MVAPAPLSGTAVTVLSKSPLQVRTSTSIVRILVYQLDFEIVTLLMSIGVRDASLARLISLHL